MQNTDLASSALAALLETPSQTPTTSRCCQITRNPYIEIELICFNNHYTKVEECKKISPNGLNFEIYIALLHIVPDLIKLHLFYMVLAKLKASLPPNKDM